MQHFQYELMNSQGELNRHVNSILNPSKLSCVKCPHKLHISVSWTNCIHIRKKSMQWLIRTVLDKFTRAAMMLVINTQ